MLYSLRISMIRRYRGMSLSSFIVKSSKAFDETLIPTNIPIGKFVISSYEKNSQWKNDLLFVDGTMKKSLTYEQGYEIIYRTASALKKLGAKHGYGVAIISPNHIYFPTVFLGTSLTGGYSITLNPLAPDQELVYQLELAEAKIIFAHPMLLPKVIPIAEKLKIRVISFEETSVPNIQSFQDFIKSESFANIDIESFTDKGKDFDVNSVAVIPFSSGTTGLSKGVMLTHRNLISNMIQGQIFEPKYFDRSQGDIVNLIPLPFFHIFGMMAGMCIPMFSGGTSISMALFDLQRFLELIQEYKVKRAFVVPPIIIALVKHPLVAKYDLSSIECLFSGAAPLGREMREACQKRLNCKVVQGWGLTETSPAASILSLDDSDSISAINGTSGNLMPGTEGKIVDPFTGVDLKFDQEGEILIRGPQVMKGYLKNEEATKATLRPDGWLHTGDIGYFDSQGFIYITDRCKELIKYKGFQVPPAELEAIILTMPEVKDAIVIPVLDDEAGEIPRAYVVKQDGCRDTFTENDVVEYVSNKVAPHKKLRGGVRFVASVPKSPAGKLLRRLQVQIDRGEIKA